MRQPCQPDKGKHFGLYHQVFQSLFSVAAPHFSDFSLAEGCFGRCHAIETHVWTLVVIKRYRPLYGFPYFLYGEEIHILQQLILDRVVYTLLNKANHTYQQPLPPAPKRLPERINIRKEQKKVMAAHLFSA